MTWRNLAQPLGRSTSKRLAILSSTAFVLLSGLALYLVYQNSRAMVARISDDFNEQQLILARQAASQIDARLRGIALDVASVQKSLGQAGEGQLAFLAGEALERSGPAGMRALAVLDAAGKPIRTWGAPADPAALATMGARCVSADAHGTRLGPLTARIAKGGPLLESALCAPAPGGAVLAVVDVSQLVGGVTEGIRSGRTGYAWVIDDAGTFLAHTDPEFVARNAFAARHERRPYISFSAINAIMKDRMLRGEEGTGSYVSGWHRGVQGEIAKLIAYSPVRSAVVPAGAV